MLICHSATTMPMIPNFRQYADQILISRKPAWKSFSCRQSSTAQKNCGHANLPQCHYYTNDPQLPPICRQAQHLFQAFSQEESLNGPLFWFPGTLVNSAENDGLFPPYPPSTYRTTLFKKARSPECTMQKGVLLPKLF